MTKWPTIGVVTAITNPIRSSYLAYLAFAEAWSRVADEVILVDGFSTDGSIEALERWGACRSNVRVIATEGTYWGEGDKWHIEQLAINLNLGLKMLGTDWCFLLGADHVVDYRTAGRLRQELHELSKINIATFYRSKPTTDGIRHKHDARCYAINLRLLRSRNVNAVLGTSLQTDLGSDWPLEPVRKSSFKDPVSSVVKPPLYMGYEMTINSTPKLSIRTIVYGHFFFNVQQCLLKIRRWDRASARFLGVAPKRDLELKLLHQIYAIKGFRTKEEVMAWDHPPEILKVIDAFYEPGMLGGAIREISPAQARAARALRKLLGLERHLRTRWMRARGYRGLKELHQWVPLDAPDPEPLDVRAVYMEQDKYLPPQYRIDWDQVGPR